MLCLCSSFIRWIPINGLTTFYKELQHLEVHGVSVCAHVCVWQWFLNPSVLYVCAAAVRRSRCLQIEEHIEGIQAELCSSVKRQYSVTVCRLAHWHNLPKRNTSILKWDFIAGQLTKSSLHWHRIGVNQKEVRWCYRAVHRGQAVDRLASSADRFASLSLYNGQLFITSNTLQTARGQCFTLLTIQFIQTIKATTIQVFLSFLFPNVFASACRHFQNVFL